jgi:DNA repair protein SbcD/Mre11
MVKLLLFGDTHLGFDHPIRNESSRARRGEDFFSNFRRILDFAATNKIDLLIHGGDFFFRSKVPQKIVTEAYEILFEFAEKGIPIVIVPGNHERSVLPDSILTRHPNIYIFTEPGNFLFKIKDQQINLLGFPFIRENIKQEFPKLMQNFESQVIDDHYNILCLHQAIEGSKVGPSNYTFRHGPDVISFSDIPSWFDIVVSGHIHRKQLLWRSFPSKKLPVIYPGSIERTSFAEMNEKKGFYVFTLNNNSISTLSNNIKFIELPTRNMEILNIPFHISDQQTFENWLRKAIADLDVRSIIKFKGIADFNSEFVLGNVLSKIIPPTMIIQYNRKKFGR